MWRNVTKWLIRISLPLFIVLFVLFSMTELIIGSGVRVYSQIALEKFPGDRAEALIAMVECEPCDIRDRNHSVWALGQLGDTRALPVLEKYYTGNKSNHLREDGLQTALRHLRREDINWSEAYFWRWMLPSQD